MQLYESEDGKSYAVLVSGGFGSPWSAGSGVKLACDKRIVEFWLKHKDDREFMDTLDNSHLRFEFRGKKIRYVETPEDPDRDWRYEYTEEYLAWAEKYPAIKEWIEFFRSIGYETAPSWGGFPGIDLEWVSYGDLWRIEEYDGSESLEVFSPRRYHCFHKNTD